MGHTTLTNQRIKIIVISINIRKTFDKIQQLMMKTLNKYAQRDMYLNIVKEINDKPTSYNSTVKSWKFFFYQEQDKDAHSHHFYSTWYWKS